ncbi:Nonsense-mediated mRNA decay protein 5 [Marasmius crinis-equi]|uniref:Nonsense-mediated mRNA decay protein 5 n=1 Tax=Marasmius crinis-equi TaxID=585013 RepID=A0ABR3FIN8_9AGAR
MDLQTLANLFSMTLDPDPNIQKAAELIICKIGAEEGAVATLLKIIATDSVDIPTRQACSVWVKNRVASHFHLETRVDHADRNPMPQSDENALRSNLLPLLVESPSRIISLQLASALKDIVSTDFPGVWPSLLDDIKKLLQSTEIRELRAGCLATLVTVKAFRFRQDGGYMTSIVESLFPALVSIAHQMVRTAPSQAQEIPAMLHLILKAYGSSLAMNLSSHQQTTASLVPWGQLLVALVNLNIPKETVPVDEGERERSEWWKAKKWAFATLGRLFHRFGNPSQLPRPMIEKYGQFAERFMTVNAPEIIYLYLRQVELYVSGQAWLSRRCLYHIFSFFTECVKPKSTWILLRPHFETLLSTFIFPHLCFSPSKQALWQNDPVDYVRSAVDQYESFACTPASAATNLLLSLATNRTRTTFLPIIDFIYSILQSNASPPLRFGALNMITVLSPWIMKHPDVRDDMQQFVEQFVAPEYTTREPYMRAIKLNKHFRAVSAALDDSELPVRAQAILALTRLVISNESVRAQVAPQVENVVQELLKLYDRTDLDILNHSIEVIVNKFTTELLPVSHQLIQSLCDSYIRLANKGIDGKEIEVEKIHAAMAVSKTIWTIVNTIESAPEILTRIQETIIYIVVSTLENELFGEYSYPLNRYLFKSMFDLIVRLTSKLRAISPNMWIVFEIIYKLSKSDPVLFLEEMFAPLDNFVTYGHEVIGNRPEYQQMLVDIYATSLTNKKSGENGGIRGCKLAESVLLNLRGHVDNALQTFIVTALDHLELAETAGLRLALLNVLISTVLYNPSGALHLMETSKAGSARAFVDKWIVIVNKNDVLLPRAHDKKLSIYALSSLLELDAGSIPESLIGGWPRIVAGILRLFKDLPKAIAGKPCLFFPRCREDGRISPTLTNLSEKKALEGLLEDGSDNDDVKEEKPLNFCGDDEDVWDEDPESFRMLVKEGAHLREQSERVEEVEEVQSDNEGEAVALEELGRISPLDVVNLNSVFKQAYTTFQMRNGTGYQAATRSLDLEQRTLLTEVMRSADASVVATSSLVLDPTTY